MTLKLSYLERRNRFRNFKLKISAIDFINQNVSIFKVPKKNSELWWFSFCLMTDRKSVKRKTESSFSPDCSGNLLLRKLNPSHFGLLRSSQ